MKASYTLSQAIVAANPATVDLLLHFHAEASPDAVARRPLNLSLVIDRSGSMAGKSLRYAIQAAEDLVERLTSEDILSVVIYDDTPETVLPPQPVQDKAAIRQILQQIRAGGCTNLSGGWLMGYDHVRVQQTTKRINRVLLLTDGQANMGIVDPNVLIQTARNHAEQGIITTTLGFGNGFNEDLLIGMANAAGGNFYFTQSPDDAADVFRIELESLLSVVAQNLTVTLQPQADVAIAQLLNNYRHQTQDQQLEVFVGDVYQTEPRQLAVELNIPAHAQIGETEILQVRYQYQSVVDGRIQSFTEQLPIQINIGTTEAVSPPDMTVLEQTSQLRIAKVKNEAIALADQGDFKAASQKLRQTIDDLKLKTLQESFEVAEEMAQLDHYAQQLEKRRFSSASRKEMRDQSYQALARNRDDLKLRGSAAGSANTLEAVSKFDQGVVVSCQREGGKLRVHVVSEGYNSELNVQFPRSIREAGVNYVVDEIKLSADGSFYRAVGNIRCLVQPGQERAAGAATAGTSTRSQKRQTANATGSAADLETTTDVGGGVLIQCVKDGSKLRARVVSDGYNPQYNIRFPRNIREEGTLYVVDAVEEVNSGGSYIAYGKIRRFVQ